MIMGLCFAPGCNHTNKNDCKMFRFPKDDKLKAKWEKLIRRDDRKANKFSLICSCHFEDGNKENLPAIFEHNKRKFFSFPLPESKRRACHKLENRMEPVPDVIEPSTSQCMTEVKRPASQLSTSSHSSLEAENYLKKKDVDELQKKLKQMSVCFSFENIENTDHLVSMYTGLPNKDLFNSLFNYLNKYEFCYYAGWEVNSITRKNQLFITLIKLKLNHLYEDLSVRFNCSKSTISNIVITWVELIHRVIYQEIVEKRVPSTNKNKSCLPTSFAPFTNCKMVLDCTEIYTAVPDRLDKQKSTYSSYKHRNTLKGLIGVSPNGVIVFMSNLYVGNTSDKKIVQHCGVLNLFKPGDLILADKGFLISDILPAGVSLNIPPFLMNSQFNKDEILQTKAIAKARIHVERAIQRIKTYKILSYIPSTLRTYSSKVFKVCGALTLFNYPLIKEVEDLYKVN